MKIIVEVRGGTVQAVYSDDPYNTCVQVYDHDDILAGEHPPVDYMFPVDHVGEFKPGGDKTP